MRLLFYDNYKYSYEQLNMSLWWITINNIEVNYNDIVGFEEKRGKYEKLPDDVIICEYE